MGTLVLVADAARARIFSSDRQLTDFALVDTIDHPAGRLRTSELVTDGRGRSHGGPDSVGSAMDAHTDPAEVEEDNFSRALVAKLTHAVNVDDVRRIVLVAPPRFLGRLREHLPTNVRQRVTAEVDRDLTKVSAMDLPALVGRHIPG